MKADHYVFLANEGSETQIHLIQIYYQIFISFRDKFQYRWDWKGLIFQIWSKTQSIIFLDHHQTNILLEACS